MKHGGLKYEALRGFREQELISPRDALYRPTTTLGSH
jgi:hypothetical protein